MITSAQFSPIALYPQSAIKANNADLTPTEQKFQSAIDAAKFLTPGQKADAMAQLLANDCNIAIQIDGRSMFSYVLDHQELDLDFANFLLGHLADSEAPDHRRPNFQDTWSLNQFSEDVVSFANAIADIPAHNQAFINRDDALVMLVNLLSSQISYDAHIEIEQAVMRVVSNQPMYTDQHRDNLLHYGNEATSDFVKQNIAALIAELTRSQKVAELFCTQDMRDMLIKMGSGVTLNHAKQNITAAIVQITKDSLGASALFGTKDMRDMLLKMGNSITSNDVKRNIAAAITKLTRSVEAAAIFSTQDIRHMLVKIKLHF